jgi:hypothetical protein
MKSASPVWSQAIHRNASPGGRADRPHHMPIRLDLRRRHVFCDDLFIFIYLSGAWDRPALFRTGWFVKSLLTQTPIGKNGSNMLAPTTLNRLPNSSSPGMKRIINHEAREPPRADNAAGPLALDLDQNHWPARYRVGGARQGMQRMIGIAGHFGRLPMAKRSGMVRVPRRLPAGLAADPIDPGPHRPA